jgi:DNA-binding winged helix-turn-helix (wHTH) protein
MRQSLTVDLTHGRVQVSGWEVRLTNKEWDILRLLVMHAGTVLTHRAIMQAIWGARREVQYLRIYVRSLCEKLEPDPEQPRYILTETGIGYRLRIDDWAMAIGRQRGEVVAQRSVRQERRCLCPESRPPCRATSRVDMRFLSRSAIRPITPCEAQRPPRTRWVT